MCAQSLSIDAPTGFDHDCNGCKIIKAHTDPRPTKREDDSKYNK